MKLTRIPGVEPTVKQYLSFKKSTLDALNDYLNICSEETGAEISFRYMVEQMLLDFMAEDKTFQKLRKERIAASTGKGSGKKQPPQSANYLEKSTAPQPSLAQASPTDNTTVVPESTTANASLSTAPPSLMDRFKKA